MSEELEEQNSEKQELKLEDEELVPTSDECLEKVKLEEKILELEDKFLRANAEFENIRKRLEKEKYQAISYANEQFARDLLPVIDALENALVVSNLASENEEQSLDELKENKIKEGIELTINSCNKCFEKHGIKPISTDGEFDPNLHNALMQVECENKEKGQIVQVIQKGYTINERVLRPSMVSIAK